MSDIQAAARIEELKRGFAERVRVIEMQLKDKRQLQARIEELERALRKIVAIELTLDYAINAASEMKRIAREAIQPLSQPPEP